MRQNNWNSRLVATARSVNGAEFIWGQTDCASIVLRCLKSMYGKDIITITHWGTLKEAAAAAMSIDPVSILESTGAVEIAKNFVTAGDVVLLGGVDDDSLPQFAMALPTGKVLISNQEDGVKIINARFVDGTRFFRYG